MSHVLPYGPLLGVANLPFGDVEATSRLNSHLFDRKKSCSPLPKPAFQTVSLSLVSSCQEPAPQPRLFHVVLAATNEVHASGRITITVGRAVEPEFLIAVCGFSLRR